MIKEVRYNGYTSVPSDYDCQDGDSAVSMNLIPEDGALKPILPPKVLGQFANVVKVFIHANTGYKHYLVCMEEDNIIKCRWCEEDFNLKEDVVISLNAGEHIREVVAMGNVIVISTTTRTCYCIWKDNTYKYIGDYLPKIDMCFALSGEVVHKNYTNLGIKWDDGFSTSDDSYTSLGKVQLRAEVNTPFNTDITLEPNVDYRLTCNVGVALMTIVVAGKNKATGKIERIVQTRGASWRFSVSESYTDITCKADEFVNHFAGVAYATLEKGNTTEVKVAKSVKEDSKENLDAMLGMMNSFLIRYGAEKGRFISPFFARYAIRLYDGSYINISPPVLLTPNTGSVPMVYAYADISACAFAADLQYRFLNSIGKEWEEIIDGLDVFVSEPIYTYNQGVTKENSTGIYKYKTYNSSRGIDNVSGIDVGIMELKNYPDNKGIYQRYDLCSVIKDFYSFGVGDKNDWLVIQTAPYSSAEIVEKASKVSNFYLLHSFKFDELTKASNSLQNFKIGNGILKPEVLANRKRLEDSMLANRTLLSSNLYVYNNRLHAYDTMFKLPDPTPIEIQNTYFGGGLSKVNDFFVYLHTSQGDKIVQGRTLSPWLMLTPWFYYPDSRAYKVVFNYTSNGGTTHLELKLKRHDFLNGAYWIADSLDYTLAFSGVEDGAAQPAVNDTLLEKTNIYVSEVNNPFKLLDELTSSVGCTKIFKVSSAAKAMSTGQFGQFPLYAFTDNGVWALGLNGTGAYIARQPFTRDVPLNTDSITQIDSAVLFATERGIMLLEGAQSMCISDVLNGKNIIPISTLPAFDKVASLIRLNKSDIETLPFIDYLKGCRMLYDYEHQRIIVFNATCRYAYVWSLKSKKWGMMQSDISIGVNSYPDAIALLNDGSLANYSDEDISTYKNLLITRPLKLDAQDILKTIECVIQRGVFRYGKVLSVLYGSNDLYNWVLVWSSTNHQLRGFSGSPYKYYRIAAITDLAKDEAISGCSIDFKIRRNNQLR